MQNTPNISVVIPLFNESESIPLLHEWILKVMHKNDFSYEVIFIDDGSTDGSWEVITELVAKDTHTHGISFVKNFGKSQALHAGFKQCQGKYVVTLDADLQDSPDEIPQMVRMLRENRLDMISGWKKKRYDAMLSKNIPSKIFNWAARKVSGIRLHDFNCGIKAYQKAVVKTIDVYGDMHRYIPVLAVQKGFRKIGEQVVQHQPRQFGETKFGADRFTKGFLDLLTLWFLDRFGKRPMHFFGLWGTFMLLVGFLFTIYLGIDKLYLDTSGRLITERPQFFIALTLMIIGVQFFIAGFLGEILLSNRSSQLRYTIAQTTF